MPSDHREVLERFMMTGFHISVPMTGGLCDITPDHNEVFAAIGFLLAENERLRAEVEILKDQNQAIASSNADHMRWHREMKAKIEAALSWVKPYPRPVSDAATIDMMVRALRGGNDGK